MSLSPARQHRLRVQAEQAAREGGSVRHASGYDLMLLQLAEDRRRLKGVSALNHLNHALQLDPRCGVKKDKQQLERRLRNDSR
ncbi:TPA: hypothetical protein NZK10_000171 [Escherichia coli]|nr:hypothetical protein [Escherichia coli]